MAQAPKYKVYRDGKYVAACKYAEDAAAVLACGGGEIRLNHRKVLFSDPTGEIAGNSYDEVAMQ